MLKFYRLNNFNRFYTDGQNNWRDDLIYKHDIKTANDKKIRENE